LIYAVVLWAVAYTTQCCDDLSVAAHVPDRDLIRRAFSMTIRALRQRAGIAQEQLAL
jgi:hypothetical protein